MNRFDIINTLIKKFNFKTYLEVGTRNRADNFNNIICEHKVCLDPDPNAKADHILTSDEYFSQYKDKFDIIFIDGLHLEDQVLKDIENSLECLNPGGYIVCHDCLPETFLQQTEYNMGGFWTGTSWKAFARYRMTHPELTMFTVDADWGCGVITRGSQVCFPETSEKLDWEFFKINRDKLLNVIKPETFLERFSS
jgi:hypothetical protein